MNQFFNLFNREEKKQFTYLIILTLFAMIFETFSIISIFPFLEVFFNDSSNREGLKLFNFVFLRETNVEKLYLYVIALIAIAFSSKALFLSYFEFKKNNFLFNFKTNQSNKLFLSYLYKPFHFHIKTNSAQLIRNLNDSQQVTIYIKYIIELLTELLVFLGIFSFLLFVNFKITIFSFLIFGIIGFIFHRIIQIKARNWGEIRRLRSGLKLEDLQKGFGAIRDIKLLSKEKIFSDYFSQNVKLENQADMKNTFILSLPRIWFEWLTMIAMIIVIFYLSNIEKNSNVIVVLGIFALSGYRLVPSITRLMNAMQVIKFNQPAIKPYLNDLEDLEKIGYLEKNNFSKVINFEKKISIKSLSFKYPSEKEEIFKNINLDIEKNNFIGIYGESGVGKTTLINLILGLLNPTSGQIYIDNLDISKNIKGWHNLISYIPQNVFIIDDKIIKNVALGENESSVNMEQLEKSLKISRIYDFIYSLPKNINTNCGELGERLSGGQRQRIGISRALYKNSKVLVFDEFTNFLDSSNEKNILQDVKSMSDKTRIIVSHNHDVLKYCEKVYELKKDVLIKS